jgi:hypothetical protein
MKDTRYVRRSGFLSNCFAFMAEMATYIGVQPRTASADPAVAPPGIARGTRVSYTTPPTAGYPTVVVTPGTTAIGDFICITNLEVVLVGGVNVPKAGEVVSMHGGGKVPILTTVAVNSGDAAYTAANGQATNVATGATFIGTFTQTTAGAGIAEVELGV